MVELIEIINDLNSKNLERRLSASIAFLDNLSPEQEEFKCQIFNKLKEDLVKMPQKYISHIVGDDTRSGFHDQEYKNDSLVVIAEKHKSLGAAKKAVAEISKFDDEITKRKLLEYLTKHGKQYQGRSEKQYGVPRKAAQEISKIQDLTEKLAGLSHAFREGRQEAKKVAKEEIGKLVSKVQNYASEEQQIIYKAAFQYASDSRAKAVLKIIKESGSPEQKNDFFMHAVKYCRPGIEKALIKTINTLEMEPRLQIYEFAKTFGGSYFRPHADAYLKSREVIVFKLAQDLRQ